ncbi:MAG: ABC transporter ATP-binding protein [Nitrospirota bacterium]
MNTYKRLAAMTLVYWRRLVVAGLLAGVIAVMTAAYAWLVKYWMDDALIGRDLSMLLLISVAIPAVGLVKAMAGYGQAVTMRHVGLSVVRSLRDRMYGHFLALPVGFYSNKRTGRFLSYFAGDAGALQGMVTTGLKDVIQNSVQLVVLVGYVFYLDWTMAVLSIVVLPAAYAGLLRMIRRVRRLAGANREHLAGLAAILQESLLGLRVIKAFAKEAFAQEQFSARNARAFKASMRLYRLMEFVHPVIELAGTIGIALLLWYGGRRVAAGTLTPGEFTSFLTACLLLYGPVKRLTTVSAQLQPILAAADRIFSILDEPTETQLDRGHRALGGVAQGLEFQQVSFQYGPTAPPVLQDVSFRVGVGEMVALVGSSGSGKSTIVNLIARFYEPSSGRVLIDGIDVRDITLASLRRLIGIVSQDTMLFQDTIRNNIAYGRADLTLEAVTAAAQAAYAHNFIMALPQGYDTVIGERGLTLSGGERQRLAIARAFLINPPILILDEATSALDYESEAIVQEALGALIKGRTTLVVAHRLSTVQRADRIVVLEGGRIVEEGSHGDLLRHNGVYRRLYERQFRDEEPGEEPAPQEPGQEEVRQADAV